MKNKKYFFAICMIMAILFSCSKKTTPSSSNANANNTETKKATVAPKVKTPVPRVIVVNDDAAKRTVDGRYYYDLNGRRYWRNNKDGKYYLFNKSMYNNEDFKPVKTN